jgi:hypothetical protein
MLQFTPLGLAPAAIGYTSLFHRLRRASYGAAPRLFAAHSTLNRETSVISASICFLFSPLMSFT